MRTTAIPLLATAILALARPPAGAAQDTTSWASRPGWSLERTMREFVNTLGGSAPGYFPSRGEWAWVVTKRYPDGRRHANVWRFPAAQTDSALGWNGPVCNSFSSGDAVAIETIVSIAYESQQSPWRRVGETRFVPPGQPAGSPYWVEWRREDGRWVISAFGEPGWYVRGVAGRDAADVARAHAPRLRLPIPDDVPVASGGDWLQAHPNIILHGRLLIRYGLPRQLKDGDLVREGSYQDVALYVEPRTRGRPEVLYVPVGRTGMFQPYQNEISNGCAP
ncbi:MAG TPA: hypothetical protein VF092_27085 [Longimicrobium sp.]